MKQILFVCTGNTCRSSMAEGLLKAALKQDQELAAAYRVSSAGVSAYAGDPASGHSIRTLRENWGIDISAHSARMLSAEAVENAFLILTMTRGHKEAIISRFPKSKGKVYTLKEYVNDNNVSANFESYNYALDILDPYGMPYEVYRKCGMDIKEAIDKLLIKLKKGI